MFRIQRRRRGSSSSSFPDSAEGFLVFLATSAEGLDGGIGNENLHTGTKFSLPSSQASTASSEIGIVGDRDITTTTTTTNNKMLQNKFVSVASWIDMVQSRLRDLKAV